MNHQEIDWASEEFADVHLGDKRLNARLIKLCGRFSDMPESPINQACLDWAETKAAYRFFHNDSVDIAHIMAAHRFRNQWSFCSEIRTDPGGAGKFIFACAHSRRLDSHIMLPKRKKIAGQKGVVDSY